MSKDIVDSVLTAYERWELPNVTDDSSSKKPKLPTAAEIEQIETSAYNEGLKSGYEDGLKKGMEKGMADGQIEINQRCLELDKVLKFLRRPLDDLDEKVIEQLFQLAMTVTGQLIRRELHTDPGQIIAVVREAMASLPITERKINIHLHPDDAALVREALSLNYDDDSQQWKINEDPLLSRGGCRLQAGQSAIDASVETRLNRIIATLLGGERNSDLNVYADVSAKDVGADEIEIRSTELDQDNINTEEHKPEEQKPEEQNPEDKLPDD